MISQDIITTYLEQKRRCERGEDEVAVWRGAHIASRDERVNEGVDHSSRRLVTLQSVRIIAPEQQSKHLPFRGTSGPQLGTRA